MMKTIRQAARLWGWWLVTALLVLVLAKISPQNLDVLPYKLVLVTAAAPVAYWLDRGLFRGASYDDFQEPLLKAAAMIRRAMVFAAVVLGMTLGL